MKIPNCPKKLASCPGSSCPMYPCWAYESFLDASDKNKKQRDKGWE